MAVRQTGDRTQIAVLEDDVLVEHYVTRASSSSAVGNVYLGRVQNVLPSMEAAFVDIGRGRNGVLYAGEVNWDTAGLEGKARSIENALNPGDAVLVQVTKDPIGHKGARLTSQISLPGRFVVYVPGGGMTGISRKLPDTERSRLKAILKKVVPDEAGVIVRTAAEGASEQDLVSDVERLKAGVGVDQPQGGQDQAVRRARSWCTASRTWRSGWSATSSTTTSPSSIVVRCRDPPHPDRVRGRHRTGPGRPGQPAHRRDRPVRATCGWTSSWPRRWTARCGCPPAVRW